MIMCLGHTEPISPFLQTGLRRARQYRLYLQCLGGNIKQVNVEEFSGYVRKNSARSGGNSAGEGGTIQLVEEEVFRGRKEEEDSR